MQQLDYRRFALTHYYIVEFGSCLETIVRYCRDMLSAGDDDRPGKSLSGSHDQFFIKIPVIGIHQTETNDVCVFFDQTDRILHIQAKKIGVKIKPVCLKLFYIIKSFYRRVYHLYIVPFLLYHRRDIGWPQRSAGHVRKRHFLVQYCRPDDANFHYDEIKNN